MYLSKEFNDVNEELPAALISGGGIGANSIDPNLEFDATYYWRVNEDTNQGDIWTFDTDDGKAEIVAPADAAVDVNVLDVELDWDRKAGRVPYAVLHNVYLSESFDDVQRHG